MSIAKTGSMLRAALLAAMLAAAVAPAVAADDAAPRKAQGKAAGQKTKKAEEPAKTATPAQCAGLQGLRLAQCQKCDVPGKSETMRFLCREGVAVTYCVKNAFKGDDPDCRANEPANRQNL